MTTDRAVRGLYEDVGELLESRRGVDLGAFESYSDDPLGFAEEVLQVDPWHRQEEILEAVREIPQVHVQGGNGVGKDYASAVAALWWTFCRRGRVLVTAAVQRQLTDVFMGEVGRLWRGAPELPGELYRSALRVPGVDHAGVTTFTSTAASKLTGFHAPKVLAIISEAQGVETFAWEAMMANATGEEDRLLACGNPLRPEGRFYQNAGSDAWHDIKIPVTDHPNLWEDTERYIPGGPSEDFVERMAREWGRDSEQFRARVEAEFPTTASDALVRSGWVERAMEAHARAGDDALDFHAGDALWTVGVDVARFGGDKTAVAVRRGPVIYRIDTWGGLDTMETVERVVETWEELEDDGRAHVGHIVVDSIGLGSGVLDRLRETHVTHAKPAGQTRHGRPKTRKTAVQAFDARKKAGEPERFRNQRSQAWWEIRDRLEAHDLLLPDDPELHEEISRAPYQVDENGRVWVRKDDLKSRIGRSPDRADAVAISLAPTLAAGGKTPAFYGK